jgi:hypothetical protein
MPVEADCRKGEFGHVGLADDHRAGLPQATDNNGILPRRRRIAQRRRTGGGRFAGDVEQILDRNDRSVERAERHVRLPPGVGGIGGGPGGIGIEFQEHAFLAGAGRQPRKPFL